MKEAKLTATINPTRLDSEVREGPGACSALGNIVVAVRLRPDKFVPAPSTVTVTATSGGGGTVPQVLAIFVLIKTTSTAV